MESITLPDSLVEQLRSYEARLRRFETLAAVSAGLAGLLVTFVLLFVSDRFVDTPRWARGILTFAGGALPAWFAHGWARHWLWNRRGPAELARLLQRHFRTLGDRLQGIIELTESPDLPPNISPGLLRAAVRQVAEESQSFTFAEAVPVKRPRRWALVAVTLLTLAAAPFVFAPKAAANALGRWLTPWAKIDRYTFASFADLPSQLVVAHGEAFDLVCGLDPDSAWKPEVVTARLNHDEPRQARLQNGRATFHIAGQTAKGTLGLRLGDASREIAIIPLHRPEMRELQAQVHLPDYLGYPESTVPVQGGSAEFLNGSTVSFLGSATRQLAEASMKSGEATPVVHVQGQTFVTPPQLVADLAGEAVFHWADDYGLTPAQPYKIHIGTTNDAAPRIDLEGLEPEMAILPTEVLKLNLLANDDYGLKDTWLGWSARPIGDPKAEPAKSEAAHHPGEHARKEISAATEFSPVHQKIPEDSVVELTAYALDYLPTRKPVESAKYKIYVLSPAKHAERVRERMDQVLKKLDERIRDEERQLDETKSLSEDKKQLAAEHTSEDLKRLEAGERINEAQMKKLTNEMNDVMKDALRNKEIPESAVAEWQKMTENLQQQATPPMDNAAQALQKANQQPSDREAKVGEAQQQQEKALEAMRQAAKNMNTANQNLYARNFYNRLRAAAGQERQVAEGLKSLARATAGLRPEEIADDSKKQFKLVAGQQEDATKDVDRIVNDLEDFVKRVPNEKYEAVSKDMQEKQIVASLTELAKFVEANLGLKSLKTAKASGEQLDAWAVMLQGKSQEQGGGDGKGGDDMDPAKLELIIAIVRAAQAEDNIRDQTNLLEGKKDSNPQHSVDSRILSAQQDELYWRLDEVREKTKFKEIKPTLQAAEKMMDEVTGDLRKPKTDREVASLEGDVIELLVPPEKKNDGSGKQSKMQQMIRSMMSQVSRSPKAGGNNGKNSAAIGGESAEGATGAGKNNARAVDKTGGAASAGEWPEEFRDQLQSYFQATEGGSN